MRRPALAILALAASFSGCSKHATEPTAAAPPPPAAELVATQPAARSAGVLYDTEIWGQFSLPLDPRTIGPTSVFLKLDGQRNAIGVTYDGFTRRILLKPAVTLALQRTYTVEFSTSIHTSDGTPIAPGVFFQFTTNSLRRVPYDFPAQGALEGPVTSLGWGGVTGPNANILYEIYASTDSLAIERRSAPPLARFVFTRLVPDRAWSLGATVFWAVTSENQTTHERLPGPVRRFRVVDPSTPLDSLTIIARDHGSFDGRVRNTAYCNRPELPCGPNFNGSIHWDYTALPPAVHFAGATMRLFTSDGFAGTILAAQPTVWMAQNEWIACSVGSPGPPFNESTGLLASGVEASVTEADFSADRLAALLEAQYRGRTLVYGTLVRAEVNTSFQSTLAPDVTLRPQVVVRFYRLPTP